MCVGLKYSACCFPSHVFGQECSNSWFVWLFLLELIKHKILGDSSKLASICLEAIGISLLNLFIIIIARKYLAIAKTKNELFQSRIRIHTYCVHRSSKVLNFHLGLVITTSIRVASKRFHFILSSTASEDKAAIIREF